VSARAATVPCAVSKDTRARRHSHALLHGPCRVTVRHGHGTVTQPNDREATPRPTASSADPREGDLSVVARRSAEMMRARADDYRWGPPGWGITYPFPLWCRPVTWGDVWSANGLLRPRVGVVGVFPQVRERIADVGVAVSPALTLTKHCVTDAVGCGAREECDDTGRLVGGRVGDESVEGLAVPPGRSDFEDGSGVMACSAGRHSARVARSLGLCREVPG
jgi:hypothetical protein